MRLWGQRTDENMPENIDVPDVVAADVQRDVQQDTEPSGSRGNLYPLAAVKHGTAPLVQRGELPAGSEFDVFRDVLEQRRQDALAWVGGAEASAFDRDDVEGYARWSTAADVIWGVLRAEGLLTRTRRRKSLLDFWERIDKRGSYYRELLRSRKHERNVSEMTLDQYLQSVQQQPQDDAGEAIERTDEGK
jgi:hypothetical protein